MPRTAAPARGRAHRGRRRRGQAAHRGAGRVAGDIPEFPDPGLVSNVCYIVTRVLADAPPGGSAVITLSRPGPADLGAPDLQWLRAFQAGAATHRTPIRMLCLATPSGVLELGPVRA